MDSNTPSKPAYGVYRRDAKIRGASCTQGCRQEMSSQAVTMVTTVDLPVGDLCPILVSWNGTDLNLKF